jgi:hypothetical protein
VNSDKAPPKIEGSVEVGSITVKLMLEIAWTTTVTVKRSKVFRNNSIHSPSLFSEVYEQLHYYQHDSIPVLMDGFLQLATKQPKDFQVQTRRGPIKLVLA